MVFDYRADGRCCTKMLSQSNLRSCSLRLRQAEGRQAEDGREKEHGRGKEREGGEKKNKSKQASNEDTKDARPKMSIKARRSAKQSGKNKRKKKEQERAGVVESTGGVTIRKTAK